jgi:hypothetical protein
MRTRAPRSFSTGAGIRPRSMSTGNGNPFHSPGTQICDEPDGTLTYDGPHCKPHPAPALLALAWCLVLCSRHAAFDGSHLPSVVSSALPAWAGPVYYAISFDLVSGSPSPTSGSFNYDSSDPSAPFMDFLVVWDGNTYDLTASANSRSSQHMAFLHAPADRREAPPHSPS